MRKLLKYLTTILPVILIMLAIALRAVLSILGWTPTNSDESMMNLVALHIAFRGELPSFLYGQYYLGVVDAYVGAVLFRIFEPSVLVMRLEMITFTALFLVVLYVLTQQLYNRQFALIILAFFTLGSPRVLQLQVEAVGYPELPLLAGLLFLVAYALLCNADRWSWQRRAAMYILWGFIAGLGLWEHILTSPYMLIAGSLLILWRSREMLRLGLWCSLVGCIIGAWPLIWYNLHALPGQDSLSAILGMTQAGQDARYGILDHMIATIVVTLPIVTGYSSRCLASHLSDHLPLFPYHLHCIAEQTLWGAGYIVLLITAVIMTCIALWHLRRASQWNVDDRYEAIQQSARLLLLIGAVLTLILYVRGNAINIDAVGSTRYLICTWVSLPAIIWPLWAGGYYIKQKWSTKVFSTLRVVSTVVISMVLVYGTISTFGQVQQAQAENTQIEKLSAYLQKAHITRFYSEYWTCNRLIFLSQEKMVCGDTWDVNNRLVHGWDRYIAYRAMVEASNNPAFVYPLGDARNQTLEQELKAERISYMRTQVDGYAVYKPSTRASHIPN